LGAPGVWLDLKSTRLLNLLGQIGLIIALSTSSATIVFSLILINSFNLKLIIIVFTITTGCYSIDRLLDANSYTGKNIENISLKKLESSLKPIILLLLTVGLMLSFQHSLLFGVLILFAPLLIILYSNNLNSNLIPLKKIPHLKDIIIALGWTGLLLLTIIYYDLPITFSIIFFSIPLFGKFYVMAVLYDFKDIKEDSNKGIVTLPNTIGVRKTKMILHIINSVATIWILILITINMLPIICFIFIAAWIYQELLILGVSFKTPLWFYYLPCDLEQVFWLIFILPVVIIWT
jgi:4-hydroxybenzoate polyprenyltransferase